MQRKRFIQSLGLTTIAASMGSLTFLDQLPDAFPLSSRMPVLFLGHGSPMNAIEENEFVSGFRAVTKSIPTPKAIICISAHWYTIGTKFTAMDMPKTIHDFGGFPKELYDIQYPAKGSPELAEEASHLLQPFQAELDQLWGLDHGSWSVIKHLYPNADIPVIQMSIDRTKSPEYHFELGVKLNNLRDKGILIIGSGNIIHNLGLVDWQNLSKVDYGYDWAIEARENINKRIQDGNIQQLINYSKQGKAFQLAIPTPEHYLPLIYTLALKNSKDNISLFNDKLLGGSLSMTSIKIG